MDYSRPYPYLDLSLYSYLLAISFFLYVNFTLKDQRTWISSEVESYSDFLKMHCIDIVMIQESKCDFPSNPFLPLLVVILSQVGAILTPLVQQEKVN